MSETRSLRLMMPTSRLPASTGTRRIRRPTSRCRTSSTPVSSVTLTTALVITSRAVSPVRASRSYSLTSPTTPPASSRTGTALTWCRRSVCAICVTGVPAGTVTTGAVMISPARSPAALVPAAPGPVSPAIRPVYGRGAHISSAVGRGEVRRYMPGLTGPMGWIAARPPGTRSRCRTGREGRPGPGRFRSGGPRGCRAISDKG